MRLIMREITIFREASIFSYRCKSLPVYRWPTRPWIFSNDHLRNRDSDLHAKEFVAPVHTRRPEFIFRDSPQTGATTHPFLLQDATPFDGGVSRSCAFCRVLSKIIFIHSKTYRAYFHAIARTHFNSNRPATLARSRDCRGMGA
ncbi:hypothetical protein PUN28_012624 [Cardiocondyla obscurior]|uniref:Uncharacterized protein n=1 Tax=Cardiocondyla obscurior TaxID=286306 RepID=A0AAW2FG82_9HYME